VAGPAQAAPLAVDRDLLRRGTFSTRAELIVAIEEYLIVATVQPDYRRARERYRV
jgi:hypothetical protein